MKKLIFMGLVVLTFLISCEGSKAVVQTEEMIRGDWTITNVSVDGINADYIEAVVFDEAAPNCFIGSQWHLVQNNNSGTYTTTGANNCPSNGTTKIKWFASENGPNKYFNFKKVYEGEKPKNVLDGYILRVVSSSDSSMILKQDLMFEGQPIGINYTFSKN